MDHVALLQKAHESRASDIHLTVKVPPVLRVDGDLRRMDLPPLENEEIRQMLRNILTDNQMAKLDEEGELDLSFSVPGMGRYRMNAFRQRGTYGAAMRVVNVRIPTIEELGLPTVVKELARKPRGLILVTGPTGSGKSTTLASMIQLINQERECHIVTLEDPIEYLHRHEKSIINQREVGDDTKSFAKGLRAALRQDPDVILVGEMRDLETIAIAITAAETGHLVMSTLHTQGCAKTIDRAIDVFPPYQQQQIRVQLAGVLEGIISQQLLARSDGEGRIAAFEFLTATPGIRNMIREGKTHQIQSAMQTGVKHGMQTMDNALIELYKRAIISKESVMNHCFDYDITMKMLGGSVL